MSDEVIETFARELAGEVEEAIQSGDGSIYSEEEFTRIVLDRLGDEGAIENPTLLWQEGNFARTKYKITGYSIPDDEERLILVTTIHTGELPPRALARDEILNALQHAMKFYECSCKGLHTKIEPSNTDASELARHIYEAHQQIGVLRIVLLSDGLTGLRSIDLKKAFDGTRIIVDLFGIERLQRILGQGLRRDDIVVDFSADFGGPLPCLKASSGNADYEAYLASVPGALLADVYEKYGTRLLELNVRAFLGLRGRKSVNAGLRATIRDLPHRFLAYNNGIVATVDAMEVEDNGKGQFGIKSVRGLQIVNGGQTTASLHRAKRQDGADLDAIAVPAKIICVGGGADLDEMVAAVSKSANSQNTVQPADFSANDPFHVAVEKLANNTWLPDGKGRWFYERARGSYGAAELKASFAAPQKRRFAQETPKERRFSKTDMAKYLNAWEGQAHQVSFGNQKNFQFFMQELKENYPDGFEPDTAWYKAFIAKAILFRAAQSIVRAKKFAAFQANIVAYTIACLSRVTDGRIDFDMIWARQAISPELEGLLESWVQKVDKSLRKTAGTRMVSEWAKKAECRDALCELHSEIPQKPPPELSSQTMHSNRRNESAALRRNERTRKDLVGR